MWCGQPPSRDDESASNRLIQGAGGEEKLINHMARRMSESFYKIVNIDITDNHIQSINSPTSDHLYGYIILWLDRKTGKSEITFLF